MWIVVYLSQSKETVGRVRDLLQKKGLLVKLRAVAEDAGGAYGSYEILVPESEVDEAHGAIREQLF
jgi:hypothetical protein